MQKLFERTDIEGMEHHAKNPVRVYTEDLQHDRIRRSVAMAQKVLATFPPGQMKFVYELGCGTGDICGQLKGDYVTGWDCNEACILHARERWKWEGANFYVGNIEKIGPFPVHGTGDLLILCETLEHLSDPLAFVRKWLPHFETVLISHPIDGDIHGDHSGGDHQWSYTLGDHLNWFKEGGHKVQETEQFDMGCYHIAISWGVQFAVAQPAQEGK